MYADALYVWMVADILTLAWGFLEASPGQYRTDYIDLEQSVSNSRGMRHLSVFGGTNSLYDNGNAPTSQAGTDSHSSGPDRCQQSMHSSTLRCSTCKGHR